MDFNLDFNIDPHPQPLSRRERGLGGEVKLCSSFSDFVTNIVY